MSEDRPTDEQVQEAAEHAARAVEHRRQMQRSAIEAEVADGAAAPALERESDEHRRAAAAEEAEAESTARRADRESSS